MGVAGAVAGTFGIQPLDGAFGVPYQAAEPRDELYIRVPLATEELQRNVAGCPMAMRGSPLRLCLWTLPAPLECVSLKNYVLIWASLDCCCCGTRQTGN